MKTTENTDRRRELRESLYRFAVIVTKLTAVAVDGIRADPPTLINNIGIYHQTTNGKIIGLAGEPVVVKTELIALRIPIRAALDLDAIVRELSTLDPAFGEIVDRVPAPELKPASGAPVDNPIGRG